MASPDCSKHIVENFVLGKPVNLQYSDLPDRTPVFASDSKICGSIGRSNRAT